MPAVLFETKGKVAYITLNRPEALNAMNSAVNAELVEAWTRVRDDGDIWVAVVTGAGERAFSAGADLKEMAEGTFRSPPGPTPTKGLEVWKPFIAAINGFALGGGCELAMACDIRIAAETATFGLPEVTRAIIPGGGGTQRLPRLVPLGFALELLLTGDRISAQEAHRLGLVNKVVPAKDLMPTAEALANKICENGPFAVRYAKTAAYRGLTMTLMEGLNLETSYSEIVRGSEDAKEGPRAFAEKRKPVYKGK